MAIRCGVYSRCILPGWPRPELADAATRTAFHKASYFAWQAIPRRFIAIGRGAWLQSKAASANASDIGLRARIIGERRFGGIGAGWAAGVTVIAGRSYHGLSL